MALGKRLRVMKDKLRGYCLNIHWQLERLWWAREECRVFKEWSMGGNLHLLCLPTHKIIPCIRKPKKAKTSRSKFRSPVVNLLAEF